MKTGGKKSKSGYNASAIEILSGLDPLRRRPGMCADTANPNHLAHEVIDNSVDEALWPAMPVKSPSPRMRIIL